MSQNKYRDCDDDNSAGKRPTLKERLEEIFAISLAAYSLLWPAVLCALFAIGITYCIIRVMLS